jgi:hypothetical protein
MVYPIENVCVYCGSNMGNHSVYRDMAAAMGLALAENGIGLVYGGGSVGLMGILADAVLENGGQVIGIIPENLDRRELKHADLSELHVVNTMHSRKALMAAKADAFVALPGGFGTFEEVLEAVTWLQLGLHAKPVAVLNVNGFYDPLVALIKRGLDDGFIREQSRHALLVGNTPGEVLDKLRQFAPGEFVPKWTELKP